MFFSRSCYQNPLVAVRLHSVHHRTINEFFWHKPKVNPADFQSGLVSPAPGRSLGNPSAPARRSRNAGECLAGLVLFVKLPRGLCHLTLPALTSADSLSPSFSPSLFPPSQATSSWFFVIIGFQLHRFFFFPPL